jgi:two-component system CheB/CheR fusion protein
VAESERQGTSALRVLVVEDDADTARTWVWLLRALGHDVEVARDGPAALRAAEANPPNAVLLDLGLPGMSGYEVAARLRQQQDGSTRPLIIAVTGYGEYTQRLRSYEVGIDLHLVKPVNPDELKGFLERYQTAYHPERRPAM